MTCFSFTSISQSIRISGIISEFGSKERLVNAAVYEKISNSGVYSDKDGYYTLFISPGISQLNYSYVGFKPFRIEKNLTHDTTINVVLERSIEKIDEILITEQRFRNKLESSQISVERLSLKTIIQLPSLAGEQDILKSLQLLPGIQSGAEGLSSLNVRGGSYDQNMILLDGIPVYNHSHLFGFLSIFNPEAINSISIIKGGYPAWYGGRVSSFVDITMKDGNSSSYHSNLNLGIISSRVMLEGPIIKDKSSFILTARRSMIDVFFKPFIRNKTPKYLFYDGSIKLNYSFSSQNRVFLTIFLGEDKIGDKNLFEEITFNQRNYQEIINQKYGWNNLASSLRWNYINSNNIIFNTQLNFSRYRYNDSYKYAFARIESGSAIKQTYNFDHFSGIQEIELNHSETYIFSKHNIKAGASFNLQRIDPDFNGYVIKTIAGSTIQDTIIGDYQIESKSYSAFLNDEISISDKVSLNIGLRNTGYFVQNTLYLSIEPRISIKYELSPELTLKSAYSLSDQYIQMLSSSNIFLPTDLWVPVTKTITPVKSNQAVAGFVYKFLNDNLLISFEGYYKNYYNLIEFKEGSSLLGYFYNIDERVERGTGNSYGLETLIEKPKGSITGWIGYTLAWSNRKFETINQGRSFPYKYDRRHNITLVLQHRLNEHFDINIDWIFSTGSALTIGFEKYPIFYNQLVKSDFLEGIKMVGDEIIQYYNQKNNYRLPAYHRLDIGINWNLKSNRNNHLISIGLYNAYNRLNAFNLYLSGNGNQTTLKKYTLFPIIPYISYSLKF